MDSKPLSFQCHLKNTIKDVFLSRGYTEIPCPEEEDEEENLDWDFIWASRAWIHSKMNGNPPIILRPNQRVNHFQNSSELTRKDLMSKNIQKFKRELRKTGNDAILDFCPLTFVYPAQYPSFLEEMKRNPCPWICKPVGGSQGQGIQFVTNETEAVQFHQRVTTRIKACESVDDKIRLTYVLQRYIQNPLLIGGKKFDIRLYALTLSYQPLVVYVYRGGFCRFSSKPYTTDNFANKEIHLTNVAVQTHSDSYNGRHGCKWDTFSLRAYIANRYGHQAANQVFTNIQGIILNSLLAVAPSVISDKHCYELYGYDILIADDLKPWLIEINASPSLDANTEDDYDLKFTLLNEMLDLVQMFQRLSPSQMPYHYGGYDLAWNGNPVMTVAESTVTSFIGCISPIKPSPNNPFRTDSNFRVKRAHPSEPKSK
ncbi:Tubulin-tyrosine ligase family protein [Histomonas meleagridis]|uniref:Tubulin-tyrosine ligase family protein n=1 Tax=Histomonas meleagridis TaxID=135588 RepID=UPI0035597803|nr:Tubulin-tyrosine ligase family protein [Histomonas meleagridis]KAH0799766.1 Tubulin-tyrosine ligase family protein [Histomonas meleagridis]